MEPDRIGAGLLQIYGQRLPHNWCHFINIQHILHWGWVWMGASCSLHFNLPKRLLKFNAGPRIIEKQLQKEVAAAAAAAEALVSPPIINHLVNFNAEQDSETKRSCGNYRKWTKETKEREKRREEQSRGRQQKPLQRAWEKDKPDDVGFDPLHAHLPR